MKYKNVKQNATVIKQLNSFGGVNTADKLNALKENQLSKSVNLWNPEGVLESRPGLQTENLALHSTGTEIQFLRTYESLLPPFKAENYCRIGAVAEISGFYYTTVSSYLLDKDGNKKLLDNLQYVGANGGKLNEIQNLTFIFSDKIKASGIFMVVALITYDNEEQRKLLYYELDDNLKSWIPIDKTEFYIPTILRYGKGNCCDLAEKQGKYKLNTPQKLEEVNIINGAFKVCFSPDDISDAFYLPVKGFSMNDDNVIIIEYAISPAENKVITVPCDTSMLDVELFGETVSIFIDRAGGGISFLKDGHPYSLLRMGGENSLKITAYKYDNDLAFNLFSNPAATVNFDGRIIRAGNFECCNKIFFSGKDNPFYFCKGASISVGEKNFPLTAIASQNRYLFLFKENEIYRLRLEESEYYDIESIIKENETADISFPKHSLTVVHSTIGCDCPNSIAFCTNRLVWYHSDGFVYCLYGSNNYTEGSVYLLSPNISNLLKTDIYDKNNISATDFDGYYFLSIANKIFVMDALVSGFRYLSGLKTDLLGGGGLSWYVWEMPKNVSVFTLNGISRKLFAVLLYKNGSERGTVFLSEFVKEKETDTVMTSFNGSEQRDIEVEFASALINSFDLSRLKRVGFNIQNGKTAGVRLFSNSFLGKLFYLDANKEPKKRSVVIPSAVCQGIGVALSTKAPIKINGVEFELSVGR